jgi:hypothetical protein
MLLNFRRKYHTAPEYAGLYKLRDRFKLRWMKLGVSNGAGCYIGDRRQWRLEGVGGYLEVDLNVNTILKHNRLGYRSTVRTSYIP